MVTLDLLIMYPKYQEVSTNSLSNSRVPQVKMSHNLSEEDLEELALEVYGDYTAERGPFAEYELPEYGVIYEIPEGSERANFITLVVSINLALETSGEEGLWQKALDLYETNEYRWLFDPDTVAEKSAVDLYSNVFKKVGWRADNAPAFWWNNARTISEKFGGDVRNLLEQCEYDATKIQHFIQEEHPKRFPSLKGPKVSALWLRLMDEEIHSLDSIDRIDIPADRNILRITNYLVEESLDERTEENLESARKIWNNVCERTDLVPVRLDKPLWLCGKSSPFDHLDYWGTWGREYLDSKLE